MMRQKFFDWLKKEIPPERRIELYATLELLCADIENYCLRHHILEKPLFETVDIISVERVKDTIQTDTAFQSEYRDQLDDMNSAISLYSRFLAENSNLEVLLPDLVSDILSKHFSNGFRLNSPIELARFRSFAAKDFGVELTHTERDLKNLIIGCGTLFEGKVYIISSVTKKRIEEYAESYFSNGAQVIFYAAFYLKNENWLFEGNVVSEGMLVSILQELFPQLYFTQTYFGCVNDSVSVVLKSEVLRVWGTDVLLSYDDLAERLIYVPVERIKYILAQSSEFIWNSFETFSHIGRIEISSEECEKVQAVAARRCNDCGYVSMLELPLEEVRARNDTLSVAAIYSAVYLICLKDQFDKNGKIITRQGNIFDAVEVMKGYCRTLDKCSLKELLRYEKDLIGETRHQTALKAGNAVLIRTDKDVFVSDQYVHFEIDRIDEIIDQIVPEDYLPLKSFAAFGAFPDCGQPWNLFLLESYCRRFSLAFRVDAPAMNSKNAGAVIRRSCPMAYVEIMANAVTKSGVQLERTAVCKFLFENGYIGRRTTSKVEEIIEKARAIYERGN